MNLTPEELAEVAQDLNARLAALQLENAALRARVATLTRPADAATDEPEATP